MTQLTLARKGYGTLEQIKNMDTTEFLDVVEYESIVQDIEQYHIQQSRKK